MYSEEFYSFANCEQRFHVNAGYVVRVCTTTNEHIIGYQQGIWLNEPPNSSHPQSPHVDHPALLNIRQNARPCLLDTTRRELLSSASFDLVLIHPLEGDFGNQEWLMSEKLSHQHSIRRSLSAFLIPHLLSSPRLFRGNSTQ